MVLELPIDVENPYQLSKGLYRYSDFLAHISNLPLYIEIYRVGDNITTNTLLKYNGRE